jgi:hypothetical protein
MSDKRIGNLTTPTGIQWPATTISAAESYRREGATILFLGGEKFAVLDTFPSPKQNELILEVQAIADKMSSPMLSKAASKE